MTSEYDEMLKFLKINEEKLKVFLSADEKAKEYRYRIKGKKSSRTIFMSEQLQFLMNEFCIENDLRIGDFVELAIIEHLNRSGMEHRITEILSTSSLSSKDEGKQGKMLKEQMRPKKSEEET